MTGSGSNLSGQTGSGFNLSEISKPDPCKKTGSGSETLLSDTRTVLLIEKKYKLFEEMFAQMKKKVFLLIKMFQIQRCYFILKLFL